jgi:hypothetical protein
VLQKWLQTIRLFALGPQLNGSSHLAYTSGYKQLCTHNKPRLLRVYPFLHTHLDTHSYVHTTSHGFCTCARLQEQALRNIRKQPTGPLKSLQQTTFKHCTAAIPCEFWVGAHVCVFLCVCRVYVCLCICD